MRQRWFSRRALSLHLAIVIWFPGCLIAGWWQVTRALGGNELSYLYSVEWPIFALVGVWGWWMLVHTNPDTVGRRAQERMAAAQVADAGDEGAAAVDAPADSSIPIAAEAGATGGAPPAVVHGLPPRRYAEEDDALAAYNDRLAELSARGPQSWRNR